MFLWLENQDCLAVMKVFYKKQKPNIHRYGSYKNEQWVWMIFIIKSLSSIARVNILCLKYLRKLHMILFKACSLNPFSANITKWSKTLKAPSINKTINTEIMKRTHLRGKFLNSKCHHGGMIQKEIQLFSLKFLFIWINFSLYILIIS